MSSLPVSSLPVSSLPVSGLPVSGLPRVSIRGSDCSLSHQAYLACLTSGLQVAEGSDGDGWLDAAIRVWAGALPPEGTNVWVVPYSVAAETSAEALSSEVESRGLLLLAVTDVPHALAMAPSLQTPFYSLAMDPSRVLRMFTTKACLIRFLTDWAASGMISGGDGHA